jgi:DNA-binding PadR family transcriptional regulator
LEGVFVIYRDRPLTDFEHVLLAYIAREPYSGYGLKRVFTSTPASVYRPSPGALYPALRRLTGRGLLTVKEEVSAGARRRRLYHATEAGRAVHVEWLRQPVDPGSIANDLGLHLMRFAMMENQLPREEVLAFLSSLAAALDGFVSDMEGYIASADRAESPLRLMALDHGIAVHRASLAWTRSALAELG